MPNRMGEVGRTVASVVVFNAGFYLRAVRDQRLAQTAVRARSVLMQAKGILMVRHQCSGEDAFEWLLRTAEDQGLSVAEVAAAVVVQRAPDL